MFALIDGNSFYCACERAFDPKLKGRPLVVLSNNDGCVIARSNEAGTIKLMPVDTNRSGFTPKRMRNCTTKF